MKKPYLWMLGKNDKFTVRTLYEMFKEKARSMPTLERLSLGTTIITEAHLRVKILSASSWTGNSYEVSGFALAINLWAMPSVNVLGKSLGKPCETSSSSDLLCLDWDSTRTPTITEVLELEKINNVEVSTVIGLAEEYKHLAIGRKVLVDMFVATEDIGQQHKTRDEDAEHGEDLNHNEDEEENKDEKEKTDEKRNKDEEYQKDKEQRKDKNHSMSNSEKLDKLIQMVRDLDKRVVMIHNVLGVKFNDGSPNKEDCENGASSGDRRSAQDDENEEDTIDEEANSDEEENKDEEYQKDKEQRKDKDHSMSNSEKLDKLIQMVRDLDKRVVVIQNVLGVKFNDGSPNKEDCENGASSGDRRSAQDYENEEDTIDEEANSGDKKSAPVAEKYWLGVVVNLEKRSITTFNCATMKFTDASLVPYVNAYAMALPFMICNFFKDVSMDTSKFSIKIVSEGQQRKTKDEDAEHGEDLNHNEDEEENKDEEEKTDEKENKDEEYQKDKEQRKDKNHSMSNSEKLDKLIQMVRDLDKRVVMIHNVLGVKFNDGSPNKEDCENGASSDDENEEDTIAEEANSGMEEVHWMMKMKKRYVMKKRNLVTSPTPTFNTPNFDTRVSSSTPTFTSPKFDLLSQESHSGKVAEKYWLGVVVNLEKRSIKAFNCAATKFTDASLVPYVNAYAMALLFMIRNFFKDVSMDTSKFSIKIVSEGFPQVLKIEDSGVYALKLIECHAMRMVDLTKLSEEKIAIIRENNREVLAWSCSQLGEEKYHSIQLCSNEVHRCEFGPYVNAYAMALPFMIRNFFNVSMDTSKFSIKIVSEGFPQVLKIEDSGVYALKLIECHAMRIVDLTKLSEEKIAIIREKLAVDIFSELQ
ncbi:hypothetical protein DY000_02016976 [Brassica cretica]|uniref:Ubiquitin-like protease family profile domain-containing protein n=1 Tax=Brassica cretica TaxID=69181 RepID=A0ABQ7CLM4_BRACR|nr:hypothetical protein DY000_02016976 [Brassica cretica]